MSNTNTPYDEGIQQITFKVVKEQGSKATVNHSTRSESTTSSLDWVSPLFPASTPAPFFYDVDEVMGR